MILTYPGQLVRNQTTKKNKMNNFDNLFIVLPKGRILNQALEILSEIGIKPERSFFNSDDRKIQFSTNKKHIKIIRVRSFDVATFLIYGAAHIGIIGSDVLNEFDSSEIYSPLDLNFGDCRMVVATTKDMLFNEDPQEWSYVRVATKYPNITKRHFEKKGVQAECIKLNGAMEIAPNLGLCRRIVDLVETGKTLKANGLIEIEEIEKVSTRLAINRGVYKTNFSKINEIIQKIQSYLYEK